MLKKGTSVLLILALVASLALAMSGCGKGNKDGKEESTESTTKSAIREAYEELLEKEDEKYSRVELTTNEHYEEDYEALTLPQMELTTKKSAGQKDATTTTMAVKRETTTKYNFEFTMSPTKPKTEKSETTTKAGATTTTTKADTSYSDTTGMTDNIDGGNFVSTDKPIQDNPNVTYLQKFVLDPMKGASYTVKTEMHGEDGSVLPITCFVKGKKKAISMKLSDMIAKELNIPGLGKLTEIKVIDTGSDLILCIPGGYVVMEGEEVSDFRELLDESNKSEDLLSIFGTDKLQYCGVTPRSGYIIETYKIPEDDVMHNFYFTSEGIQRWEVVSLSTGEVTDTMVIKLQTGVADKNAFETPGKKYTMEEIEKMFGTFA